MRFRCAAAAAVVGLATSATAIQVDFTSGDSIKSAAKTIATKMVAFYPGDHPGGIPGLLGDPYYWWEAGAMFGSLIDYWYYTGDDQFNDITTQALVFQLSPTYDYMPPNQTKSEGNDDQMFWGAATMTAAEYKYPPPPDGTPSWISIAEAVFNSQAERWDNLTCGGGLRWQIFTFNNGYDYKNTPSNAGLANLGARLFAYTGNSSYAKWVNDEWDFMSRVGLISPTFDVYDGTSTEQNCSSLDHHQWTYSAGMLLNTAAVMWNMTATNETANGNQTIAPGQASHQDWEDRVNGIWNMSAGFFFQNKVLYEIQCEPTNNCDTDQLSFKAYFARFLYASTKWAPFLYDEIKDDFGASAAAAAAQCSGGDDQITCGTKWTTNGVWDGTYGVGQQLSALEMIQGQLIQQSYWPVTNDVGGISHGNATLGTEGSGGSNVPNNLSPISTADRAGAGILTALVLGGTLAGGWWLVS